MFRVVEREQFFPHGQTIRAQPGLRFQRLVQLELQFSRRDPHGVHGEHALVQPRIFEGQRRADHRRAETHVFEELGNRGPLQPAGAEGKPALANDGQHLRPRQEAVIAPPVINGERLSVELDDQINQPLSITVEVGEIQPRRRVGIADDPRAHRGPQVGEIIFRRLLLQWHILGRDGERKIKQPPRIHRFPPLPRLRQIQKRPRDNGGQTHQRAQPMIPHV